MGVGFAKDAEHLNKQNLKQRKYASDRYFKKQQNSYERSESIQFKTATEEELERVRKKIKNQQRSNLLISIFVVLSILLLLVYFLFIHDYHRKSKKRVKQADGSYQYEWVEQ